MYWPNWGFPDVSRRLYTQLLTRNPNLRFNIFKSFRGTLTNRFHFIVFVFYFLKPDQGVRHFNGISSDFPGDILGDRYRSCIGTGLKTWLKPWLPPTAHRPAPTHPKKGLGTLQGHLRDYIVPLQGDIREYKGITYTFKIWYAWSFSKFWRFQTLGFDPPWSI